MSNLFLRFVITFSSTFFLKLVFTLSKIFRFYPFSTGSIFTSLPWLSSEEDEEFWHYCSTYGFMPIKSSEGGLVTTFLTSSYLAIKSVITFSSDFSVLFEFANSLLFDSEMDYLGLFYFIF